MYCLAKITLMFFAIARLSTSSPLTQHSIAPKESHSVPPQWTKVAVPSPEHVISLHIGLKQGRFSALEKHLTEISDPANVRYGQYLSHAEVNELIRPSNDTFIQVQEWLSRNDVDLHTLDYSLAKDWINVKLPVSKIETLLNTTYSIYRHSESGSSLIRAPEWSLPFHLHEHIDTIQPTTSFFRPNARRSTMMPVSATDDVRDEFELRFATAIIPKPDNQSLEAVCSPTSVTPRCLRTLYGTIDYKPQAPKKVSMGLNNYLGETSNRSDARLFLTKFRPEAMAAADDFSIISINDGKNDQSRLSEAQQRQRVNSEGNLDAQTMLGIAYPIHLTAFNTGGEPPFIPDRNAAEDTNEPYAEYLRYLSSQPNLPSVISSSYGDGEQTVPRSYALRICHSFAQLGARGISFLVSSGDLGVGKDNACFSNDGKNVTAFQPDFPASCPYVTAIGGTKGFTPEVAALNPNNGFTSGGGFSNYFGQPAYQAAHGAMNDYIEGLHGKHDGLYNKYGRGYPDISAQSQGYLIAYDGKPAFVDGTSAACPTAAAIVALINDALVAAGKPVLGFLNPWLYARGFSAFTDIVSGSAQGCNTDGFPAKEGWDPVTGFGTPYFPKFKKAALSKVFRGTTKLHDTPGPEVN